MICGEIQTLPMDCFYFFPIFNALRLPPLPRHHRGRLRRQWLRVERSRESFDRVSLRIKSSTKFMGDGFFAMISFLSESASGHSNIFLEHSHTLLVGELRRRFL